MISSPQTLSKLARIEARYRDQVHVDLFNLKTNAFVLSERLSDEPDDRFPWAGVAGGWQWGCSGGSAWFRSEWTADRDYDQPLYVRADTGGCEALLRINGKACGIFNHADYKWQRGDHRALLLAPAARKGETFRILVEAYAGHEVVGVHPGETPRTQDVYRPPFIRTFNGIFIAQRDEQVKDLVVDLHVIRTLAEALPERSFRKGQLLATLDRVYACLWEETDGVEESVWRAGVTEARTLLGHELAQRNGDSAPRAGLIGHSHMDTAWLWTIDETRRKCARTYSNVLRLMEQYPEYRFVQSSALHAEFMRENYPDIFAGIKARVAEGRWEPNGGVWVEPDVNLAGGEALIRQFLVGRKFTREHFGYTGDTFWLPDTFGYSAALPQILVGCGIRYFLTTKLTWNDTNSFPHDTFSWEGIDGTRVFTHFNDIHCAPDPGTLINKLAGTGPKDFRKTENCVRHPDVNQARLVSFGRGDGGGGPDFEMLEMARRVADLDGCPRATYTSVSDFMAGLQADAVRAPLYVGELYFEGHRGALTQQAAIKRLNRAAEFALRNLDYCAARARLAGVEPDALRLDALWRVLLLNQFHDILPGTSIPEVHDRAIAELGQLVADARAFADELLAALSDGADNRISIHNTLGWTRDTGWVAADLPAPDGVASQEIETPWGERRRVLAGLALPPLGAMQLACGSSSAAADPSPFAYAGNTLLTPHAALHFDAHGRIVSWLDTASGRELRDARGGPLNALVFGEDIPAQWDNWDIDEDLELKLAPLLSDAAFSVVAAGPLQLRLRRTLKLGRRSTLTQDLVVHAHTARVDFETVVDWEEPHRYLGVEFPLAVHTAAARHEIQFGHLQRGTHRNFAEDRARFEVSQHKWTDLSETHFGVALLNDGKYGLSVLGSRVRLSLIKGGGHPDPRGDKGVHTFTYSLLPHNGGWSVESVVRPAYELNTPLIAHTGGTRAGAALIAEPDAALVVETVKPAESGDGVIVRLYDAAGSASRMTLAPVAPLTVAGDCNLLEDPVEPKAWHQPFALRTVRLA
ncbi:MAG: glycoside hydrolase family 38 C-terminal domain-containing protein [Verrucomicrobiota bacterium]